MTDYYKPNEIWQRWSKGQVKWLLENLNLLRSGSYPKDPKETGFYDTPVGKRQVKAKASFLVSADIYSELTDRIESAGLDGLLLELAYSSGEDDRIQIEQHISSSLKEGINETDRRINRALKFVAGKNRKRRSYHQWRNHKGGKNDG